MKKVTISLVAAAVVALFALPVAAQGTQACGWEDGTSTILGFFGNLVNPTNVGAPEPVHTGARSLRVTESPEGGTPQAFVAFIEGLTDGDMISASFWGWDDTPSASPSLRIWGHYALSGDINSYAGSAGGNSTYTDGTGWSQVSMDWTFDSDGGTRDALIVEARLYSPTGEEPDYYVDDVEVTSSAGTITLACGTGGVAVEGASWGGVKALYR
jgi:hypothetical protein